MKDIKIEIKERKIRHEVTPTFFHRHNVITDFVYDVFVYENGDLKHQRTSLESVEKAGETALLYERFYNYFVD